MLYTYVYMLHKHLVHVHAFSFDTCLSKAFINAKFAFITLYSMASLTIVTMLPFPAFSYNKV